MSNRIAIVYLKEAIVKKEWQIREQEFINDADSRRTIEVYERQIKSIYRTIKLLENLKQE